MRALLFSNSTNAGEEYLEFTIPYISEFIKKNKPLNAVFIPYAAITISYDDYFKLVALKLSQLGISLKSVHQSDNPIKSITEADLIIIGGGNTFQLIACLQQYKILTHIQNKVLANTPYIGWSAGSNVACPTIRTTNDMPVVEPESFNALNLVPFQINPHYTDAILTNHAGETREMRILEYIQMNKQSLVVGLREGSLLWIEEKNIYLKGEKSCRIFKYGNEPKEFYPTDDFSFLMQ